MERKQLRKIFTVLKKEFSLDKAYTVGVCCNTCSVDEYYTEEDKRVIFNKQYLKGMNKSCWDENLFIIGYNAEYISYNEMNLIGKRFIELAKTFFNENYSADELYSNYECLQLVKQ